MTDIKLKRGLNQNGNDSWFSGPMMTVIVGDEHASWNIHLNVIAKYSAYFKKLSDKLALSGGGEKKEASNILANVPRAPSQSTNKELELAGTPRDTLETSPRMPVHEGTSPVADSRTPQAGSPASQVDQRIGAIKLASRERPETEESQPLKKLRASFSINIDDDDDEEMFVQPHTPGPSRQPGMMSSEDDDDVIFQGSRSSSRSKGKNPEAKLARTPQTPSRARTVFGSMTDMRSPSNFNAEDRTEIVHRLPNERAKIFGMIVRWVYGTEMMPSKSAGGPSRKGVGYKFPPPDEKDNPPRDFIDLYLLGQRLQMRGPCNVAIDTLYDYYGTTAPDAVKPRSPQLDDVLHAFDNTVPESQLRALLMVHVNLWIFSESRKQSGLPPRWKQAIQNRAEFGFHIIDMMTKFEWVIGENIGKMNVRPRASFYESAPPKLPGHIVKEEDGFAKAHK